MTQMDVFRRFAEERAGRKLADYAALHAWSIQESREFWPLVWEFVELIGERGKPVVDDPGLMPGAKWFADARLNFAENLLRVRDETPALIGRDENGRRRVMSHAALYDEVSRCQAALREAGVSVGDRVAAYMPNTCETVVGMLAAVGLGAVWSSCSPDFGVQGALDRLAQIEPRVLIAADGYHYGGKSRGVFDRVVALCEAIPSLARVIVVENLESSPPDCSMISGARLWAEDVSARTATAVHFEALPFDHPLYIMYSSGTTGLPKAIVHGAGGTLLQHLKELVLHTDLRSDERIAYYTTCGWMMWNWLVSALATGAAVVLIDGSPFLPRNERLFDIVDEEDLDVLGVSAKFIAMAEKHGLVPSQTHRLSRLRALLSTGSPLSPESFDWVYTRVKPDLQLTSISGGTDIISCFALGNPAGPVRRGELQCRGLGMAVEVYDDDGIPLPPGTPGELVCTRAFVSMPTGFFGDDDGARYQRAYFERYPGVWHHGDFAEITTGGGVIFHGRSDATLNPGGVRIGTAEIYRVVENFEEIVEAVVVGQEYDGDTRVALFVRLAPGATLDDDLRARLVTGIRTQASPHHVPRLIAAVPDLPRTISGKVSEIAVRKSIHGEAVDNRESLANPESLEIFRKLGNLSD
jgi:acetoacetyl-CoA synthetase